MYFVLFLYHNNRGQKAISKEYGSCNKHLRGSDMREKRACSWANNKSTLPLQTRFVTRANREPRLPIEPLQALCRKWRSNTPSSVLWCTHGCTNFCLFTKRFIYDHLLKTNKAPFAFVSRLGTLGDDCYRKRLYVKEVFFQPPVFLFAPVISLMKLP